MSPETNVEYLTSPDFPILHAKFRGEDLDFFPGQIPGKSMVIYESRESVLGGHAPECIFVRNYNPEFSVLYPSSNNSQGKLLSAPRDEDGYCFWVGQKSKEVSVKTMSFWGGFREDLTLWIIRGSELIREGFISSNTGVALIPVINEFRDHSGLILCDQSDLARPEVQKFLGETLGWRTKLPLDKPQMDIPALVEAGKV